MIIRTPCFGQWSNFICFHSWRWRSFLQSWFTVLRNRLGSWIFSFKGLSSCFASYFLFHEMLLSLFILQFFLRCFQLLGIAATPGGWGEECYLHLSVHSGKYCCQYKLLPQILQGWWLALWLTRWVHQARCSRRYPQHASGNVNQGKFGLE